MLFYSSRQTNQIRPFNFWENLLFANLVFNFIWPLGAMLGTLKHWSRCQRLVEHLSFHMKYLERKFDKTNFVSPKKKPLLKSLRGLWLIPTNVLLNFNLKMDFKVGTLRGMKRVGGDAPHLKNDVCWSLQVWGWCPSPVPLWPDLSNFDQQLWGIFNQRL